MIDAPLDDVVGMEIIPLDGPRSDWWDSQWHVRHLVRIDTSKLSGPVTDFPVLIRLRPNEVTYSQIGANGAALRFVQPDHVTIIPHDTDTYTNGQTSFVWIKVSLDPAQNPKQLYLYYDNPAVASSSNPPAVFGAYTSTHHLGGAGLADASGHMHAAAGAGGSSPGTATANIGTASTFDGGDFLELPNEADFDFTTEMSVSAWVKISGFDDEYQAIVAKGDTHWRLQRSNQSRFVQYGTNINTNLDGTKIADNDAWHHLATVYDGTTKRLYFDGALDTSVAAGPLTTNNTYRVQIGQNQESGDNGFTGGFRRWQGSIDEVRIASTQRSAAWINAEYLTVVDMTFATVGPAETY